MKSKAPTNGPPPDWVIKEAIAFGRPTAAFVAKSDPDHTKVSSLVSNDYNRRFLNDVLRRNALEVVVAAKQAAKQQDSTNRTFHLRANSVAAGIAMRQRDVVAEESLRFGGGGDQRKKMIINLLSPSNMSGKSS